MAALSFLVVEAVAIHPVPVSIHHLLTCIQIEVILVLESVDLWARRRWIHLDRGCYFLRCNLPAQYSRVKA